MTRLRLEQDLTPGFTWTDALILLIVGLTSETAGLTVRDMLAAGDYLNHAILTYEELLGAVRRLSAADLVAVDRRRYSPTTNARSLLHKAKLRRLSLAAVTALHTALAAKSQTFEAKPGRVHSLSRAVYTQGVSEYLGGRAHD